MRKLVLILGVIVMSMSSFKSAESVSFESTQIPDITCTIFANNAAREAEQLGGNYFQAWFDAYAFCVRNTTDSL